MTLTTTFNSLNLTLYLIIAKLLSIKYAILTSIPRNIILKYKNKRSILSNNSVITKILKIGIKCLVSILTLLKIF